MVVDPKLGAELNVGRGASVLVFGSVSIFVRVFVSRPDSGVGAVGCDRGGR